MLHFRPAPHAHAWACRQPEKEAGLVSLSKDGRAGLLHEVEAKAAVGEVRVLIGSALEGVRVDTQHKRLGETCNFLPRQFWPSRWLKKL